MSAWRWAGEAAWIAGLAIFAWILWDAWRTSHSFDERLLLSSREGEIENDLKEVAANLEQIESRIDRLPNA